MKTIGDLLSRDLGRKIEEIIQVDQADEPSVHAEITEYVATDSIRDQYGQLLKAIAEAPSEATESVGVWVSGFFGSGKSSFAKNLGYALQNRRVLGDDFATLFKRQIGEKRIGELLDLINRKIPTEVILFEVAKERDTRKVTERIAELMYTVLLRELGYAEDFDIAELEIELEGEGKLDHFVEACQAIHKLDWKLVRKGAQKLPRASAVLHHLDRTTYPSADSWSHAQLKRAVESYEDLTGGTVDMDKAAIAEALKAFAAGEMKRVLPVEAQAQAHGVPVLGTVGDYRESLAAIESGSADDCVTILAGGGASLKQGHDRVRKIADCLDEKGLATLRDARRAGGEAWNLLDPEARAQLQPKADAARELLSTEALLDSLSSIQGTSREIWGAYRTQYESRHADRTEQFRGAIEKIKGREEWTAVPETMREPVLASLQSRCYGDLKLPDGSLACEACRAGPG